MSTRSSVSRIAVTTAMATAARTQPIISATSFHADIKGEDRQKIDKRRKTKGKGRKSQESRIKNPESEGRRRDTKTKDKRAGSRGGGLVREGEGLGAEPPGCDQFVVALGCFGVTSLKGKEAVANVLCRLVKDKIGIGEDTCHIGVVEFDH